MVERIFDKSIIQVQALKELLLIINALLAKILAKGKIIRQVQL